MKLSFALLGVLVGLPLTGIARTWTDAKGRKLEADFVGESGDKVKLKLQDGKEIEFPLKDLSAEDQKFVTDTRIPEPAPEPVPPKEGFPIFDYGVAKSERARAVGRSFYTWGSLAVEAPSDIEHTKFEKAMRPVLGAGRVLEFLGLPKGALPDKSKPLALSLLPDGPATGKAAGETEPKDVVIRPSGRMFVSMPLLGLAEGSMADRANDHLSVEARSFQAAANLHLHGWVPFLPGWLMAGVEDYTAMLPLDDGWPQTAHARVAMKQVMARMADEKNVIVTPQVVDDVLRQPMAVIGHDANDKAYRMASLLTFFYLRHIHGDGQGGELKKALAAPESKIASWLDFLRGTSHYEEVWEQIKADPSTIMLSDGRYRVSSGYEVPVNPKPPLAVADRDSIRAMMNDALRAALGDKPGETVINGLIKAGFTKDIASNPDQIASFYQGGKEGDFGVYNPKDVTPDYTKVTASRPHVPLEQRQWPVAIIMGTQPPLPTLVRSNDIFATYRIGHFEFQTGPGLTMPLVREVARVFTGMEEVFERLPWGLPPKPPEGGYFKARLYSKLTDYQAIAPPLSGGFYSRKDKVFHVPYVSLGLGQDPNGKWNKMKDFNPDTLMHEMTHMMMDQVLPSLPIWVIEGSAEYVEALPRQGGSLLINEMPRGLDTYLKRMQGIRKGGNGSRFDKPSAEGLLDVLRISREAWTKSIESGKLVKPVTLADANGKQAPGVVAEDSLDGNSVKVRPQPVTMLPVEMPSFATTESQIRVQRSLYMHSCLLFYYFLYLDNPNRRGDPMLTFIDKAGDVPEQLKLYEQSIKDYEGVARQYVLARTRFNKLPGVTFTGDGRISYPSHMVPPKPPPVPRPPVDLSKIPDHDFTLAHLDVLIKGRSDAQLAKAFREGFARIGITIE